MKIARSLQGAAGFGPSAVTIGNFDGTHIGHRQLLRGVVEAARDRNLHATVLTFDPHPAAIVAPERPLRLLSTHTERSTLMRREGIRWINSTAKSIEEIATTILRELRIQRQVY